LLEEIRTGSSGPWYAARDRRHREPRGPCCEQLV